MAAIGDKPADTTIDLTADVSGNLPAGNLALDDAQLVISQQVFS